MSTQHTPGPWSIEHETDVTGSESSPEIGCVGKVDIAHVYLRTVPGKSEANARLIAAAPDLLAALKRIADLENIHFLDDAQAVSRAAIAKVQP